MNPRRAIIATVLAAFQGERSTSAVLHLLNGKKSVQTIQDGAFFRVLRYFSLFPDLSRSALEDEIRFLRDRGDVVRQGERVVVTRQGLEAIDEFHKQWRSLSYVDGWKYNKYMETVWLRLCLYLQALSYIVIEKRDFYPITHRFDIQKWVKRNVPETSEKRKERLAQLYEELYRFFSSCDEKEAFIVVHQFSGYNKVGLTRKQLADYLRIDVETVYFLHLVTLHKLFFTLEKNASSYPLLASFLEDLKEEIVLTDSAKKTWLMLRQGYSLKEISERRQLKENTIEDHIVEIALQSPNFSIRPFIDAEREQLILDVYERLKTSRLRELKQHLPDDITYFMLRLVLAKKKVGER